MLKTRLWTTVVALPTLLAVVILAPAWFFTIFIAVLGVFGLYEVAAMTGMLRLTGISRVAVIGIFALLGALPLFGLLHGGDAGWMIPTIVIIAMLGLTARIALVGPGGAPGMIALAFIGAAYVGVLFPYFAMLRNSARGIELIILMLLLVIASDSGAYFVGRRFGRVKLMPRVSPNKTVEGAIGGLASSIAAGLILRGVLVPEWNDGATTIVSMVIAILAQAGDLAGSALKRSAGVKDSGWIFPGHGGLLDRTCSLVFAVVFTYYYSK